MKNTRLTHDLLRKYKKLCEDGLAKKNINPDKNYWISRIEEINKVLND